MIIKIVDIQLLALKISRSENLPVLPTVVVQILKLYEDPNISARRLEHIIEQDPAMSAKVLRVAGSSMYGLRSVNTVKLALSVMGMNTLRSIAISLAYQQILSGKGLRPAFDHLAFWRHSLAVGIGARGLMRHINMGLDEEMYVAGLMHGIGILTMDRFAQPELINAVRAANINRIPLRQAELTINGFDHCQVGGILAEKWKLTPMMTNVIKYYDNPEEDLVTYETTIVAAAANHLAYHCGFPAMPGVPGNENGPAYLASLGLEQDKIDAISTQIMVEVDVADETMGSARAA